MQTSKHLRIPRGIKYGFLFSATFGRQSFICPKRSPEHAKVQHLSATLIETLWSTRAPIRCMAEVYSRAYLRKNHCMVGKKVCDLVATLDQNHEEPYT